MKTITNRCATFGAFLVSLLVVSASNSPSSLHTIDFSTTNNLKAVFDAGLKPWRFPGLEKYQCALGKESLKIILPQNCVFDLEIEHADILVLAGNQLSSIELDCPQMSYTDAAKQVEEICQAAGIQTAEFQAYVDGLGQDIHKPFRSPLLIKKAGVELHVIYEVAPMYPPPPARVSVTLTWAQPNGVMKFLTEPIQPPPGYESVSMDSPGHSAGQSSNQSNLANLPAAEQVVAMAQPTVLQAQADQQLQTRSPSRETTSQSAESTESARAETPSTPQERFSSASWPWLLGALIATGLVVIFLKNARQKK